jgi:hypothetical protein
MFSQSQPLFSVDLSKASLVVRVEGPVEKPPSAIMAERWSVSWRDSAGWKMS